MLAFTLKHYVDPGEFTWQIPLLISVFAAWLGGGFLLLRLFLKKHLAKPLPWYRYLLVVGAAGVAAAAFGALIGGLFYQMGKRTGADLMIPGAVLACLAALAAGLLVIYLLVNLPFRRVAVASIIPLAAILLACGGLVAGMTLPAMGIRQEKQVQNDCLHNLIYIAKALERYGMGKPPASLKVLTEKMISDSNGERPYLEAKRLRCPGRPQSEDLGYFYHPPRVTAEQVGQLMVCDFGRNHGHGRAILMSNEPPRFITEADFQELLTRPENSEFAAALKAAEKSE